MVLGLPGSEQQASGEVSRFESAAKRIAADGPAMRIKVLDFGLSRVVRGQVLSNSSDTREGVVLGSPGYMSPEQARGEPATTAADIFGFGCVLFEMFYGHEAFDGETSADRLANTLRSIPQPDPQRRSEDEHLANLIDACLSKPIDQRPDSAADLARQLREPIQVANPIIANTNSGYAIGEVVRRRFLAAIGGGCVGLLTAAVAGRSEVNELTQVRSLAVLSLDDPQVEDLGKPLQDRHSTLGEKLSALLVNELGRLDNEVAVPPFRPMTASSPDEFRQLGTDLDVDAFVTGTARPSSSGGKEFLDLDLQIVSATTGKVLWSHTGIAQVGDNLLEQSRLATEIADKIGRRLTSTQDQQLRPRADAYKCLVDGKVHADPDSVKGMEMALVCLDKARKFDPRYAEPVAGISLTAIMLAAQTDASQSQKYVQQSKDALVDAMDLDPKSVSANLANAILQWQVFLRYSDANAIFEELSRMHPYNWQVHHQYGLLASALGQHELASRALLDASRMNSMSMLIKIDSARAEWFKGNPTLALVNAMRDEWKDHEFAIGLAIDIHEQQQEWDKAAGLDPEFGLAGSLDRTTYTGQRAKRVAKVGYGPFGAEMNQAIFDARFKGFDELRVAGLAESPAHPMFPFLLAAHPAFEEVRKLKIVRELRLLPKYEVIQTTGAET